MRIFFGELKVINTEDKVAVCSRSFSKNPRLREELYKKYAHVTFNEEGQILSGDSLVEFLKGHSKAITALEIIDENILSKLPDLKVISKYGVGLDSIDLNSMNQYGKSLGWTGGVNRRSVSELVIAFAIMMLRNIVPSSIELKQGGWRQIPGGLISNRTFGIVGCGHIGKDLIQLLKPFGCRVLVNDIKRYPEFYLANDIEEASLDELMRQSDIVTLHVPLDESTFKMIDRHHIGLMKKTALLINIARGGIVDELELKIALQGNKIAGAAFDVFYEEPPQDLELLNLPNFITTPHIGGSSSEAIFAMGMAAINGLDENQIPKP
jgi:phosphoglycerate dehydrogenase-like enzyme